MGLLKLTKEITKILLLLWMPLTAPLAASLCPAHLSDEVAMPMADMDMSEKSHCEKMQEMEETTTTTTTICDCPACALSGVIPLAQVLQIDEIASTQWRARVPHFRPIYLNLDTPPPQYL